MIRKLLRGVWIWGPPLALMLVIFFLSSRQSISVSDDLDTNFVIFKSLHIIEYACLTLLFIRAQILSFKLSAREAIIISALMALAYGISDEIHQTFVPVSYTHLQPLNSLRDRITIRPSRFVYKRCRRMDKSA